MSKWGLLRGAGQGMAQAGNMLMADRIDQMKEQRLQKYQEGLQQKQFEREDTLIANANTREDRILQEERDIDMQKAAIGQANRLLDRDDQIAREGQAQENFELTFEQSKALTEKQMKQIDQDIDLNSMALEDQREIRNLRTQITESQDPEEKAALYETYRILTGTDKDDKYSLHINPEYDPDTGERIGSSMYTHNSRTNVITPYGGAAQQDRSAELLRALGLPAEGQEGAAAGSAQGSTAGQSNQTSRGLLNPTLRTEPWTAANAGTGAMERAEADSLTSSQRQQVGQQITMSQRAGQAAAQGVVMAIDSEGKVRALSLSMLQAYLKENPGVKFINGFIEGIGNFNNGRLEQ
jgi:hypothetical protein